MSFNTALRRRLSCTNLIPYCQAAPLNLLENDLGTHDLALRIRLASSPGQEQVLCFLITTPSSAGPENVDATLERVQRFAALSGGRYCAVLFHLSPAPSKKDAPTTFASPLHAFNALQIKLFQARLSIPFLPVASAAALSSTLTAFTRPFTLPAPGVKQVNAALDVLPFCTTAGAPMSREALVRLTDVTARLRDVAQLREEDGDALVEAGLDVEDVSGILEFWRSEWVAE